MSVTPSKNDDILRLYDMKRLRLHHERERKQQEVYEKVPRIKEIDDTISSLSVNAAKALLLSKAASSADYKEQLASLRAEKVSLMAANFPDNFLEPDYECSECKDTGYVDNRRCKCFKKHIIDALYEQSNLKEVLQKENFSTFNLRLYCGDTIDKATGLSPLSNISHAIEVANDIINTFGTDFKNLFIYGATGVGKTFLTNCIAKELIDKAHSVVYISAIRLFDIFADNAFEKGNIDAKIQYDNIFDSDLLIIDDLGTELVNNFTSSRFFNCINERFLNHKPVIISTNLSLSDLRETYSERIFSRITSNITLIKIFGDALSIKKALK